MSVCLFTKAEPSAGAWCPYLFQPTQGNVCRPSIALPVCDIHQEASAATAEFAIMTECTPTTECTRHYGKMQTKRVSIRLKCLSDIYRLYANFQSQKVQPKPAQRESCHRGLWGAHSTSGATHAPGLWEVSIRCCPSKPLRCHVIHILRRKGRRGAHEV